MINEAAASGVAVIVSSACGATSSLVQDDVNGFTVDASNDMSIAEALSALSPDRRRQMGAASRRIVAEWGPERFASGLRPPMTRQWRTQRVGLPRGIILCCACWPVKASQPFSKLPRKLLSGSTTLCGDRGKLVNQDQWVVL